MNNSDYRGPSHVDAMQGENEHRSEPYMKGTVSEERNSQRSSAPRAKVLHIVIDARESGTSTGRYVDKLIEHLHKLQPDYRITILTKPHRLNFYAQIAPTFTALVCPHKEFTFDEQISLKKQIESLKPDLVHFAMVQQPVLYQGRVVTTMHDLTTVRFNNPAKNPVVFAIKQAVYKRVNKRVAHKSNAIIVPTQFVKDDVIDFCNVDPQKITVTYESADPLPTPAEPVSSLIANSANTLPTSAPLPTPAPTPAQAPTSTHSASSKTTEPPIAPFIMYVGRPTPHKNLERLIQAFAILQKDRPDLQNLRLVLAGKKDANYQRIEDSVNKQGITNVVFTDFISDQQLRWLYEHCQAYIFPSLSEGFGLPGLEAMVHSAPVVSSNATCLPEVYGDAVHYFDPNDTDDMVSKINEVLTDDKLRQQLIARGRKQITKYSWERMAEQTLAIYERVLEK